MTDGEREPECLRAICFFNDSLTFIFILLICSIPYLPVILETFNPVETGKLHLSIQEARMIRRIISMIFKSAKPVFKVECVGTGEGMV